MNGSARTDYPTSTDHAFAKYLPTLSAQQACALSAELRATLVEYHHHADGWSAFVVTPDAFHHVPLPLLDQKLLKQSLKWIRQIESPIGRNRLSYKVLYKLYEAAITPLQRQLPQNGALILCPFGPFQQGAIRSLSALSAACDPISKRYLAQSYTLAFATSLSRLHSLHQARKSQIKPPKRQSLLSVAYPGTPESERYLPNVLAEVESIGQYFSQVTQLHEDAATPDAVIAHASGQDVIHFGCHGKFDPTQPQQSGLMLAHGEWLTVERIMNEMELKDTHLVILSACESGTISLSKQDGHTGLTQAIIKAGAQAVISSQWKVDDAATRILFEHFYAKLAAAHCPADALRQASQFVRRAGMHHQWEHPYYWAAFTVSGLAYNH